MTSSSALRVAVTAGEPAGIGPDIVLAAARRDWSAQLVVIADRSLLEERARLLDLAVDLVPYDKDSPLSSRAGTLTYIHQPLARPCTPGFPDPRNAPAVLDSLDRAAKGCLSGEFDAMVTAPVNKAVISDSGTPFSGHTEYLANVTESDRVVMLLAAGDLRVALATTHMPLSAVPDAITQTGLESLLAVLHHELQRRFAIEAPRITVLGLNPHAGEAGHLGREEITTIIPAIEQARSKGLQIQGPVPADTAFSPSLRAETDVYLAMYHDQGLPVLKYVGFGGAVNITLGLPIIRSSVDHGTAESIAGTGKAESGSLFAAIDAAVELALIKHRR